MTQHYFKTVRICQSNRESINDLNRSDRGYSEFYQTSIRSPLERRDVFQNDIAKCHRNPITKEYFSIFQIIKVSIETTRLAKYFVVLAILQTIWNIRANATPDEVSTSVTISGSASYGYEEHHPNKLGCLGKNSKSAFDYDDAKELSYQTNQGSAAIYNTIDEGHSIQNKIENQSVDWNFNFDKEDYTFHLKFKKNAGKGIEFHNRRNCNTRSWHYKIDNATSKVKSSVSIIVPSNVWIVEIENLTDQNVGNYAKFKIKNIYSKGIDGLVLGDEIVYQPIHYFYVSPGDEIKLELEFDDTGSNIDLISELKVTFFGGHRCDQIIKASLGDDQESFSPERILSALKSGLNSSDRSGVGPQRRQTMLFLGCLTARPMIQKLLFNNDINDVKSILAAIESINSEVIFNGKNNSIRAYDHTLADIGYMARYSISHSILDSSRSMCKEYPFLLDNGEIGLIKAYMRIRHHLDKILEVLKLNENSVPQIALDLKTISEQLQKITRDEIHDGSTAVTAVNNLGQSYLEKGIVHQMKRVFREANEIPRIDDTKSYEDFRNSLRHFYSLVKKFNLILHVKIESFDANEGAKNDFSEVDQITSQIEPAGKQLGLTLRRFLSQFEGQYAKNYVNGLLEIEERHYESAMAKIEGQYNGHFRSFFGLYQALNLDNLSNCLDNSTRSGK